MMVYNSEAVYINSCSDAASKIAAIDNLIDVLLTTVLLSVGNADTSEYMLNDGQTTIKKIYRNPQQVLTTAENLRALKALYANDINGGTTRMVDSKNLVISRFGRW